jgi:diguanylate cyclase
VFRKRHYVLLWTIAWLLLALALFALSRDVASQRLADFLVGVAQLCVIGAGLIFIVSVDLFRDRPPAYRAYFGGLLPLAIWFTLAPLALGAWSALVPGHLVAAGLLGVAGVGYLVLLLRARLIGAGVIGLTFALIAAAHLWLVLVFAGVSDTSPFQILSTIALLYIFAGFGMHLMVFEDMTYELRRANRRLEAAQHELRQLVITDALTGCYNRRFFDEVIGHEIQRHRRYASPLAVLFIDVDQFKVVNDSLGHEAGDRLLQLVAGFLLKHIREADYVFRWGGDEFLVLLTCTREEAERKGIELKARFARAPEIASLPRGVGLSVGSAQFIDQERDALDVVREADARMYADKERRT